MPALPARRVLPLSLVMAACSGVACAQPAETCDNAIPIGNGTFSGTTLGATIDGSASCSAGFVAPDVWYLYSAPAPGNVRLSTCAGATTFDTVLSVHTACPGGALNEIACNDNLCLMDGQSSTLSFTCERGRWYLIRVSGSNGGAGTFELRVTGPQGGGIVPENDSCWSATPVADGSTPFTSVGAIADVTPSCGNMGSDIWFAYTALATGAVTADTCAAADFDTVVAVYAGGCDTLIELACNDNACGTRSSALFQAMEGSTYLISVGGAGGDYGTGVLRITGGDPPPPPPGGGADIIMSDSVGVSNWGPVGGYRGYTITSHTCNIGDTDLLWQGTTNRHPVLGMHVYRLHHGAIEQIGISWCKNATNSAAHEGCGPCNGHEGSVLGSGCMDIYDSDSNGRQENLGPRSDVNAFTGHFTFPFPIGEPTGNAVYKRCRVRESDLREDNFPGALYFIEGVWVAPDDGAGGNGLNNASYRRVTVEQDAFGMTVQGQMRSRYAAIFAWRDHGGGVGVPDLNVQVVHADVPSEGRFTVGARAYDNGDGTWRYEYAVFNLNSHRSGGSFSVPVPPGAAVYDVGFHDVDYHSGEPYDNTDWWAGALPGEVRWTSPQTYAQNPSSNVLRWGTLYNFRFTTNVAPAPGLVTIGLFRPGTPASISAGVPVPGGGGGPGPCAPDWNADGALNSQDFFDFLASFFSVGADFNSDGASNSQDFFDFLAAFFTGC